MSFFGWLASFGLGKKKKSAERLSEKAFIPSGGEATTPKILLAYLADDKGGMLTKRLGALLTDIDGIEVFHLKKILKLPSGAEDPFIRLTMAVEEGCAWIKDEGADILVWGEVGTEDGGLTLRLLPAPDHAEGNGGGETLEIPGDFGDNLEPLVAAVVLGAFGPTFKGMRVRLGENLGRYLEKAEPLIQDLPTGLNNIQAISTLNSIGNAYVAYSHLGGGVAQLDHAAKAYREAEKRVRKETQPLIWSSIQNHLASVLLAQGQMQKNPKLLRSAALIYSNVAGALSPVAHKNDWCSAQTHLGRALYILAGLEGKPEYLQTAAKAYEAALGACDKVTAPGRWAEVTNQYGVVLLALGEEMGGDAALEKAVSEFRNAMKIHQRDKTPILWAQTANNLGAACFALAKRNFQSALLREASDCFEGATEIYREQGISKQVQVSEKNLHRVKRLLISRSA